MLRATMLAQSWKPRTQKKACSQVYLEKRRRRVGRRDGERRGKTGGEMGEMRRDAERCGEMRRDAER